MVSPGCDGEADVAQHPVLAFIGEPDVVEFDGGDAAGAARGDSGGSTIRLGIEQLEDALGGRHGALQDVVLLAQVLDGPEEAQAVLQKRDHHAERERSRDGHAKPP